MKKTIKVTMEYYGQWTNTTTQDYKIVKLSGAVNVNVLRKDGSDITVARVGDIITEVQAASLASQDDIEVTVLPKSR